MRVEDWRVRDDWSDIDPIGRVGAILREICVEKNRLTVIFMYLMIRGNTGKEVIQKFMSSNHSEVAAA
jgi:hypothetical protein